MTTIIDDYLWIQKMSEAIKDAQAKNHYVCDADGALMHDEDGLIDEFCRVNPDSNLLEVAVEGGTCYIPAEEVENLLYNQSIKVPALLCTDKAALAVQVVNHVVSSTGLTTQQIHDAMSKAYDLGWRDHHIEYFKNVLLQNEPNTGFVILIWPDTVHQGFALTAIDPAVTTLDYSNEEPPIKYGLILTGFTTETKGAKRVILTKEYFNLCAGHEHVHGAIFRYVWRQIRDRLKKEPGFSPPKTHEELATYKIKVLTDFIQKGNLSIEASDVEATFPPYMSAYLMTQDNTKSHARTILPKIIHFMEETIVASQQTRHNDPGIKEDNLYMAERAFINNIDGVMQNYSQASGLAEAYVLYHISGEEEKARQVDQTVRAMITALAKPTDSVSSPQSQLAINIGMSYVAAKKVFLAAARLQDF